jgi:hypothetical protein
MTPACNGPGIGCCAASWASTGRTGIAITITEAINEMITIAIVFAIFILPICIFLFSFQFIEAWKKLRKSQV